MFPVHLKLKIEFNFQIGHYCPSCGTILIDGREIQDYDHKYLHEKIAMVGREPILFNRTIKENITYGIDDNNIKDDTALVRASEEANAHGFVTDSVNGYNTICGQRGEHFIRWSKTTSFD